MRTFQILWDDFHNRNTFEKRVARPFTYVCLKTSNAIEIFLKYFKF